MEMLNFFITGVSRSQFRKRYFNHWITHPDQITPPPSPLQLIWAGRTPLAHFLNSQILNQKPQTKAICSLSCCAWSALVMHLDQPGGRPSKPKPHKRAATPFSGLHSYSNKMWTAGKSQATDEGLISPLYL